MKSAIYDPVKRRCVVHQVLKDFLSMEHHMKALWVLEDNYSEQRSLPILEYIDQIEQFVHLGDKKKALRERLTKELYFSENIGEDPLNEMMRFKRVSQMQFKKTGAEADTATETEPQASPTPAPAATSAPQATTPQAEPKAVPQQSQTIDTRPIELIIFSAFMTELNKLFTTMSKGHIQKFYSYVITMLVEFDLKPEVEANVTAWCHHNGKVEFNNIFTVDEMQQVLHACYLWAVEFFGPDDADHYFSRVVHEVEKLPQADEFPPQNLL
jgi:hypothetical protein